MAYCNISDAFNINGKFQETIKGLQSFNPMSSDLANLRNSYGSLTNIQNDYEAPYDGPYETCDKSLNGTNINNLLYNQNNQGNQIKNENTNSNRSKTRLTHRDCINIYTKPTNHSDEDIGNALKHITKCTMCKEQIKKLQNSISGVNSSNPNLPNMSISNYNQAQQSAHTTALTSLLGNQIPSNAVPPITTVPTVQTIPSMQEPNVQIENQLKMINDRINGETNLKYQNAVLQNTISKYMDDAEEKKAFNSKIDRILDILQNQNSQQVQPNQMTAKEYFMTLNSMYRPEMFQNINNSNELNYLTIGIVIIIILLIVDIFLRINARNKLD